MTIEEANEMMMLAPQDNERSAINKGLTRAQAVWIVRRALNAPGFKSFLADGVNIDLLFEKRVYQVCQDNANPAECATWMV